MDRRLRKTCEKPGCLAASIALLIVIRLLIVLCGVHTSADSSSSPLVSLSPFNALIASTTPFISSYS